ncbi:1,4-alpha-glucan branching enzyme, partial [Streptomyces albidus (ex Kaewkla and Franco 2022)]|uniref:1,4-alpha-glucan branching enzyme n=1 Tax=Streptomyces albidus (ex Kaewkla and Franco 2022) TaxID=722709 RepID=UPI003AF319F5
AETAAKAGPGVEEPEPVTEPVAGHARDRVLTPPVLAAENRRRLLEGTHDDPHAHLGAHLTPDGALCFRTLRPHAYGVTVLALDGKLRAELRDEGDGFFAGQLTAPDGEIPAYELLVQYGEQPGENDARVLDAYALPPALGSFDLRLIREGRHEHLWRALGARTMTHCGVTGTRFTVWAPNARGVRVAGDFNEWDGTASPMRFLSSSGVWELFLPGVGDGTVYKFEVVRDDGSRVLHADPMARAAELPPANGSVVHTSTHRWRDGDWLDRRGAGKPHSAPVSLYELHLPSWRPGLTYRELAEQLPAYVRDLGFTHVELMPCAEHPFGGSWGYQVTGFFAPTARLGGPDDFKYLIDALHRAGIGVIMDWAPAHFPKDEWALARFDSASLYENPGPPRGGQPGRETQEFDFGRPEVRNFLVANAVYWCEEFHVDGLRVDAVGSMLRPGHSRSSTERGPESVDGVGNPDAVSLLQEMNAAVHRRCPGVITAAEECTTWDGVTRATNHQGESGFGGLGFSFKWNTEWMQDSLGYAAREPAHRPYHHEQLSFSMAHAYAESYILPVPHDEVGHGRGSLVSKMPGDWWEQRATHRAYLGFMWAHPGKQLLFMGQEFAQGTEWSQERGPDWWLLDPSYEGEADHRGVRDLVRDLNAEYMRSAALWQQDTDPAGFSWIEDGSSVTGAAAGENVFAFLRFDADGGPLLAVSNFSSVPLHGHRLGVPRAGTCWREVLNTDDLRYGGSGVHNSAPLPADHAPAHGRPASVAPTLPALATVWLRPEAQAR